MKILFCNIAWMKNYVGITEDDKPINGGKHIEEYQDGGEIYNFHDYDGKCLGYVMINSLVLEKHFDGVKKSDDYVDGVLVVWVATNEKQETRIVGWYKNARVYRDFQFRRSFTNSNFNLDYNISADAMDCYLLPEENRTFHIERASQSGPGTGLGRSNVWYAESSFARTIVIPKVLEYIEGYKEGYKNSVHTEEDLLDMRRNDKRLHYFDYAIKQGLQFYENEEYYRALVCFYSASLVKETSEVLYYLGKTLFFNDRFSKAIEVLTKIEDKTNDKAGVAFEILKCYDLTGNREQTLLYADKIINLLGDSEDDIADKLYMNEIKFSIYYERIEIEKAKEIIEDVRNNYDEKISGESLKNMESNLKALIDRLQQ